MRLDKFLTSAAYCSRKDAALLAKKGRITVDGTVAGKADTFVDPASQKICVDGIPVVYREFHYIMMNKPAGIVSATDGRDGPTVIDLLPENLRNIGLFPCGRLDKSTTGFVLLTNDGVGGHRLLSPKHHVEKEYRFRVKYPLSDEDIVSLCNGVRLRADSTAEEWETAPCKIVPDTDHLGGCIILTEGKYHEIKRMMEAVHNQITSLFRVSFAGIRLDPELAPGEWRYLTETEESVLHTAAAQTK